MNRYLKNLILTISVLPPFIQLASQKLYYDAFNNIEKMLSGTETLSFQKAIFVTENAYLDNSLDYNAFNNIINSYSIICKSIINSGNILYPESDKAEASAQCAVFLFMTDSIPINVNGETIIHTPFEYNFDDFAGQKEWSSMFVSTLMETKKGNCHSMPLLYKMIMDELGYESHLALAPNHMYIKANNKRVGWYNIELTNGNFPTDAWLTTSGYIHTDAIRNGIYMKPLSEKESIAFCLIDLAQGYQVKFGIQDGSFILTCCELAMEYYPNYINALLLLGETLTELYKKSEHNKNLFVQMNDIYTIIHDLGYRKMPQSMYMNWLSSMGLQETNYRMKSLIYNQDDL